MEEKNKTQNTIKRRGSLEEMFPEIAAEWNYEKNNGLLPQNFVPGSGQKVWWRCEKGHEWEAVIRSRTNGIGCPYCSGHKTIPGENDLLTLRPDIAAQWNYEKNNGLLPQNFAPRSNKKVWWRCEKGHEWQSSVLNRVKGNSGCPYCANQKVLVGYNDLLTLRPDIAAEWNYEKNNGLLPQNFVPGSNKKVWWKCNKCNNEWQAKICDRTHGLIRCPVCKPSRIRENTK